MGAWICFAKQTMLPTMDTDTFLTQLYVFADEFCKMLHLPKRTGPSPALSPAETLTLSVFSQWKCFSNQKTFYRWAERHLRSAFPRLPDRSQFNRQARQLTSVIAHFSIHMASVLGVKSAPFEILDTTACPTRNRHRGGSGWLAGQADIGWSSRLQWYEGFNVLLATTREGVITGFGFGAASSKEQHLTEAFLSDRARAESSLPSAGTHARLYLADKGFEGFAWQQHWGSDYGAEVITPPKKSTRRAQWSKPMQQAMAALRQHVERVVEKLHNVFSLEKVRPHALSGFWVALASKVSLHNFCIWVNRQLHRPDLAFTDLMDW